MLDTINVLIISLIVIKIYLNVLHDTWAGFQFYERQVILYTFSQRIMKVVSGVNPQKDLSNCHVNPC